MNNGERIYLLNLIKSLQSDNYEELFNKFIKKFPNTQLKINFETVEQFKDWLESYLLHGIDETGEDYIINPSNGSPIYLTFMDYILSSFGNDLFYLNKIDVTDNSKVINNFDFISSNIHAYKFYTNSVYLFQANRVDDILDIGETSPPIVSPTPVEKPLYPENYLPIETAPTPSGPSLLTINSNQKLYTHPTEDSLIFGGQKNDTIYGGGGDDILVGDDGKDKLFGDNGNDTTHGGDDDDTLHGGNDHDLIYGSTGKDKIYGDNGNDVIYFDENDMIIDGGNGIDNTDTRNS